MGEKKSKVVGIILIMAMSLVVIGIIFTVFVYNSKKNKIDPYTVGKVE